LFLILLFQLLMNAFFTTFSQRLVLLAGLLLGLAATAWAQVPAWQTIVTAAPLNANSGALVTASTTDASGNTYVAGSFTGSINLNGTTYTSVGVRDLFIAKWSPATQGFVWVQQSAASDSQGADILVSSGSSVYLAGSFYGTASIGGTTLVSAGGSDAFVAKLTDAGSSASFAWAQRMGGAGYDSANGLAVSSTAVYVSGTVTGTATFGSTSYTSAGSIDGFLTKLTDAGSSATFTWTQLMGGLSGDYASGLAAQGTSLYVLGSYMGVVAFGSLSLNSGNKPGLFVAKLTDTGLSATYTWVQQAGSSTNIVPNALALQGSQVYVAGRFQGTATFGSISVPNASTTTAAFDAFVAKLTDAGSSATFAWAYGAGGPRSDYASALAVRGSTVYVAGSYSGTASFGGATITSSGTSDDIFVARLTDLGPTASFAWVQTAGGPGVDTVQGLAPVATAVYVGGSVIGAAAFGSQTVGSASAGQAGFFAALPDATSLAATASTPAAAGVNVFPTPTPAHGTATVQLPAGLATGSLTLTVLDGLGRIVRTRAAILPAGTTATSFDVAGLAPGVYALRVAVGERLGTARLVVE